MKCYQDFLVLRYIQNEKKQIEVIQLSNEMKANIPVPFGFYDLVEVYF